MFDLPSNIRFDSVSHPGVLRVSYVELPATPKEEAAILKNPLDVWGAVWILHHEEAPRVLDIRPPRALSRARLRTLVLRVATLQESLTGIEFRVDGTSRYLQEAAEIRGDIRSGLLLTFDRSNLHRGAATGRTTPEDGAQAHVVEHGKKFLLGTFPHRFLRQFPAQVFKMSLSEPNRATTKFWIDLVSADKEGRLSAIAMKVGDPLSMDAFAAGLDGAIFCREFRSHLVRNWMPEATSERIALYLVADRFHPALHQDDGSQPALSGVNHPTDWLDVIWVQIESSNLPAGLSERIVCPAMASV